MRPDGSLILLLGVSRSGKSVYLKALLEKFKRVIVWDPKGEYVAQMGFTECKTKVDLVNAAKSTTGAGRIAFVSQGAKNFDFFCGVAMAWNKQAMCAIIPEELAEVTNAGKAAGNWGRLVSQGLAFGPTIIGTVQRGQEVDKSIMNNATYLHICRHNTESDRRYIADKIGCEPELIPSKPLEFVQWSSDLGIVSRGLIDFKGPKRAAWQRGSPRFSGQIGEAASDLTAKKKVYLKVGDKACFTNVQYR